MEISGERSKYYIQLYTIEYIVPQTTRYLVVCDCTLEEKWAKLNSHFSKTEEYKRNFKFNYL